MKIMCYLVKYEKCGKTTWKGCGKMLMSKILEKERCN